MANLLDNLRRNFSSKRFGNSAALAGLLLIFVAVPLTVILVKNSEDQNLETKAAATRDPLKQPFASNSIWNTAIGSAANYVFGKIDITDGWSTENAMVILSPDSPARPLLYKDLWWDGGVACNTGMPSQGNVPVPDGYLAPAPPSIGDGTLPNRPGGVLLSDRTTIREFQYATRCSSTGPLMAGAYRCTHSIYGSGQCSYGAQGGSGLSGVGGVLRNWEVADTGPIQHALKITISAQLLSNCNGGYRWPAVAADGYHNADYNGTVCDFRMGSLMALQPTYVCPTGTGLAARICQTLKDYGAYIGDTHNHWSPFSIIGEVGTQTALSSAGSTLNTYAENLYVITNNSPSSIGGGGNPRQLPLPDLCPTIPCSGGGGDTTNPTATLTAPANGATVSGSAVTLSATAADNVGVSSVQFFVDGQSVNTDSSSPYSYVWDSTTKANGTYPVYARAVDAAGNPGNSTTINITVSNTVTPPPPPPTGYTVDNLVADMEGTTQGTFCGGFEGWDWPNHGDGLPSSNEAPSTAELTGWGTAQWATCGVSASGVRIQLQNFRMHGLIGGSWVAYGGQIGEWCAELDIDTYSNMTGCSNSSTVATPNWRMPTGQRAIHWGTFHQAVKSGTQCMVVYYEAKSVGSPPLMFNIGADNATSAGGIQGRQFVSRYKAINSSTWTPMAGSNCSETTLRGNPPPGLGGGGGTDTTAPVLSNGTPSGALAVGTTSTNMTVTTNEAATCKYGTTAGVAFASIANTFSTTGSTNHSVSITGLTNGTSRTYYIRCRDVANNANSSDYTISFSVALTSTLPAPWVTQDIGTVGVAGSASHSSGTFTINGSGDDIWNAADAFRFVYQDMTGDGTITARVVSQTNTDPWAKAAVMIREDLSAGSKNAIAMVTPGNGTNFQYRSTAGADGTFVWGSGGPMWVRLQRAGNTITGFRSSDGTTWTNTGSTTITMGATAKVGLAVTSHNNAVLGTVSFTNVSVSGSTPPPTCTKTGDINCDNSVNVTDLNLLINNWATTNTAADLNHSGKVDLADLTILINNWGR